MSATHNYNIRSILGSELDDTMTLVGESGGLSSIYEVGPSNVMPDLLCVVTEHGFLYLDPETHHDVLDET